ncbi:MAG TPA: apolipoprotein N-acyltransferase [Acidimicrobiales bacterium]|nr:apolipoprotein N-acyltransferase [Acidimicrobiales bacterium]
MRLAACVVAGVLTALSVPPWGWWPLAFVGLAVLAVATEGVERARRRAKLGLGFGLGMFVPGLWWMSDFHAVGGPLVMLAEAAFVMVAVIVAPPSGRWRVVAFPAALVLAEAVRATIPFGGLPMAGIPPGQVDGPLAPLARVGGELLILGAVALVAMRRVLAVAAVVLLAVLSAAAPDGGAPTGHLDVAVVQGGGRRGFRAVDTDPRQVFEAHVEATAGVRPGVDVVVWPEDVVDVDRPITEAEAGAVLAATADGLDTVLVAGVVEDVRGTRFANAAVAWGPDGQLLDRYDKVHRVPFGEYVPGRSFLDRFVDLSVIPRDAVPGTGPGRLDTPAGRLGVVISFEVFFADRARAAANAGGRLLLVPTNAASFKTSQVPTTQVAAARLRALETGRDLVQAAPTGYGAVVDHHGRLRARTTLGRRQVVHETVALRDGRTVYARFGDAPVIVLAAGALAVAWWRRRIDQVVNSRHP